MKRLSGVLPQVEQPVFGEGVGATGGGGLECRLNVFRVKDVEILRFQPSVPAASSVSFLE